MAPRDRAFFTTKKVRLREAGLLTQGHTTSTRLHKELTVLSHLWVAIPRRINPPAVHLSTLSLTNECAEEDRFKS